MLCKVEIIFPQSPLHCQHTFFSPWRQKLYPGSFAEASEIFTHSVFQIVVVRKTTSSERIFEGTKMMEVGGS